MDLDGDGYISMYEMEYFYEEQMQKMEAYGIERLPFEDCLCQVMFVKNTKRLVPAWFASSIPGPTHSFTSCLLLIKDNH